MIDTFNCTSHHLHRKDKTALQCKASLVNTIHYIVILENTNACEQQKGAIKPLRDD